MSGKVGTLRYMAVEVAMHRPYNVAADVYSWSMVCYELMTLQKPFGGWTRDMHSNLVCGKGVRPEFTTDINQQLKSLLEQCWAQKPRERPNMRQVLDRLRTMEEEQLLLCSQAAPSQTPQGGSGGFMRRGMSGRFLRHGNNRVCSNGLNLASRRASVLCSSLDHTHLTFWFCISYKRPTNFGSMRGI